ncbi:MAG: hypothetical protein ACOYL6_18000 [Bacteriovoracaceae bacterium]
MKTWSLFILFLFISPLAWAGKGLPKNVLKWIEWETKANSAGIRSMEEISLKHFEIPLSKIKSVIGKNLDPQVYQSLIFEKNGESYVRWIINPEDTEWAGDLGAHLRSLGLDSTHYTYFKGYLTASRSMVIYDEVLDVFFSAKVSTNKTGGKWQNKKLSAKQAMQSAVVNTEMVEIEEKIGFVNTKFMHEPLSFAMEEIDQGMVIRSLDIFKDNPSKYYLPGFSAVHPVVGKSIAELNGSDNPAKYWLNNGVKLHARSNAEFVAVTGRNPEAGHWQNHLFELDENFKSTGYAVFRDFSDSEILKNIHEHFSNQESLNWWPENHVKSTMSIPAGPVRGNKAPPWLPWDSDTYGKMTMQDWLSQYFDVFNNEFSRITGVPLEDLAAKKFNDELNFTWIMTYENNTTAAWKNYYQHAECLKGKGANCPDHFKQQVQKFLEAKCSGHFN